jgi:hypothetical protein
MKRLILLPNPKQGGRGMEYRYTIVPLLERYINISSCKILSHTKEEQNMTRTVSLIITDETKEIWEDIPRGHRTEVVEKLLIQWDRAGRPDILGMQLEKSSSSFRGAPSLRDHLYDNLDEEELELLRKERRRQSFR